MVGRVSFILKIIIGFHNGLRFDEYEGEQFEFSLVLQLPWRFNWFWSLESVIAVFHLCFLRVNLTVFLSQCLDLVPTDWFLRDSYQIQGMRKFTHNLRITVTQKNRGRDGDLAKLNVCFGFLFYFFLYYFSFVILFYPFFTSFLFHYLSSVWINSWLPNNPSMPSDGWKHSGPGRTGGLYSMDFYTELKTVNIRL